MTDASPEKTSLPEIRIDTYAETSYLQYAVATVTARALAQVEDGNKPVHRRILYAMRLLGLTSDAKPVKCARIVGDVLGKYHPHGDTSVYDALVRMAQDFSLRYPLITGQGNFGSRDGDGAAAMRYTEAKLSPISRLLLDEMGQGTVDFVPNYDGSYQEPKLVPSRLPFTLLNGGMGIAVGMAADIPPHNIREVCAAAVAVLENPHTTLDEILALMPGPDFPDGGQLISSAAEIRAAYESGRGSLRVRARWVKEDLARNQWQLVVQELPYLVSTKKILTELDTLTNPQIPAGKKSLSQQQINLKAMALEFLEHARDESGKQAPIRLVLIPKTSKVDPDAMMAFLLSNTSLEDTFGLNCTLLGLDRRPATMGVAEILRDWCTFRVITVRRRTQNELDQARRREHILQGRLTVFMSIDAVIKIIRESEDPKPALISSFGLSDEQCEDILEMRLRQLNRLEGAKLEKELSELKELANRLVALLASETALKRLVVKEITADCEKFGDDRRTLIKQATRVAAPTAGRSVLEEPLTLVVSKNLWVRAYKGTALAPDTFVFKAGDELGWMAEGTTTTPLVILDTNGRAYSFASAEVPLKGEGAPLSTFIDMQAGALPLAALSGDGDALHLFSTAAGYGFLAPLKSLWARPKAGKTFQSGDEGVLLLPPVAVPAQGVGYVVCISEEGKLLAFPLTEVKTLPAGGKGVVLLAVDDGKMSQVRYTPDPELTLSAKTEAGKVGDVHLTGAEWLKYVGKRARKGMYLPKKARPI
jgi:topoisomerase-4 subunit A